MATNLDFEEQEQIEELKTFWKRHGRLLSALFFLVLLVVAGWNFWTSYETRQASKASVLFDELDKAGRAGDKAKILQISDDLQRLYPRTVFAQQGSLLAAKNLFDTGQLDDAQRLLTWLAKQSSQSEYQALGNLRLAGLLIERKQYDLALSALSEVKGKDFEALALDRQGDIFEIQGKKVEARQAFAQAYNLMAEEVEYRRLVEAKLTALGAPPTVDTASTKRDGS